MSVYRHYKTDKLYWVMCPSAAIAGEIPAEIFSVITTEAHYEPDPRIKLTVFRKFSKGPVWIMPSSEVPLAPNTIMVVYREAVQRNRIWVRTFNDFHARVEYHGVMVSRFGIVE